MRSKEEVRLKELYSYNILNTPPEPQFDDLLDCVATICEVPSAFISFIDDEKQWYKAKIGLEGEGFPREKVFCNEAIKQKDTLYVPDLTQHETFKNSPFVKEAPHLKFYAGNPITTPSGNNVGTLCVLDTKSRELSDFQLKVLKTVSQQVVQLLELRKKNEELNSVLEELKHHQSNMVQAEKLASLGRMAGGIAHELNNPLQIVNSYLELIAMKSRDTEKKEEFQEIVRKAKNTVFRMARIIQTMLGFVKSNRNFHSEDIILLNLVEDSIILLTEKLNRYDGKFEVKWEMDNQLRLVCQPIEISQVIINLITNGMDASKTHKKPQVTLTVKEEGSDILFTVSDNGEGVPADLIDKIQEPFFTTKEVGQGTGLGLHIVYQVAERMDGKLEYARENDLTYFTLRIPFKKP